MIHQLYVPAVVPDVEEIRILEWHLKPGEAVAAGEMLVELETHKAVIEVRAGQSGVLRKVMAQAGDWLAVGVPLAYFSSEPDEAMPDDLTQSGVMLADFEVT